jgi:flotillin
MQEFLNGGWVVPAIIVVLALAFLLIIRYAASRYKKIAPGKVGVFYGREFRAKDGQTRGYLILAGGGRVQRPILEEYVEVPVEAFQLTIKEEAVPNKDNVKVNIEGIATCRVSTDPGNLDKAITGLLSKLSAGARGESTIEGFVQNILTGHLRSIVGKMTIEELIRDRDGFNKNLAQESKVELANLGIDLINLAIKEINDREGYIEALGKKAVASAKAQAEIEVSNAERDAETTKANNAALVAAAQKDSKVKQAQYTAESETQRAKAETAYSIAKAGQEQTLVVAEADRDAAQKKAQIAVQQSEGERKTAELQASVVAEAKAAQQKTVIDADAAKQKRAIDAEAEANYLMTTADAKKKAAIAEGEGIAEALRVKLLAEAEGNAAAKKMALLGEAEGTEKLAQALQAMNESSRMIIVLDRLPNLFATGGDAAAKVAEAVFRNVAAPFGSIDKINILDMGGGDSSAGLKKLGSVVPDTVFSVIANAQARGLDIKPLLKKVGIDPAAALEMLGMKEGLLDGHAAHKPAEPPLAESAPSAPAARA